MSQEGGASAFPSTSWSRGTGCRRNRNALGSNRESQNHRATLQTSVPLQRLWACYYLKGNHALCVWKFCCSTRRWGVGRLSSSCGTSSCQIVPTWGGGLLCDTSWTDQLWMNLSHFYLQFSWYHPKCQAYCFYRGRWLFLVQCSKFHPQQHLYSHFLLCWNCARFNRDILGQPLGEWYQ